MRKLITSLLIIGLLMSGCSIITEEVSPVEVQTMAILNPVFFGDEIIPIFDQYCNSHCHSITHLNYVLPPALTDSVAYRELISGGYVDTLFPEQSLLYLKVTGEAEGLRMPPSGKLSDPEIRKILDWIKEGAPNN